MNADAPSAQTSPTIDEEEVPGLLIYLTFFMHLYSTALHPKSGAQNCVDEQKEMENKNVNLQRSQSASLVTRSTL